MPAVPYTIAQQIVGYLLLDMMLEIDLQDSSLSASQAPDADAAINGRIRHGFPILRETKNPFVKLDYILCDCVVYASSQTPALLEKYRDHFDRNMQQGLIVLRTKNRAVCTATQARNLESSDSRPECVLMKNAVYLHNENDPAYDMDAPAERFAFVLYHKETYHLSYLWAPTGGKVRVREREQFD
ncbi:hypothetical protein HDU87_004483 [Geranomyces variabilis]|uniref:Uncharacterized protein n=1 Tax=Geranomyces variabilis TaxID=109894 RepID=A0AAD5TIC7_9FUNG|nr:hypothetical protein HDU87_004483 [Geranomyces variabilis]